MTYTKQTMQESFCWILAISVLAMQSITTTRSYSQNSFHFLDRDNPGSLMDIPFDAHKWRTDRKGQLRQAMVKDLIHHNKNLFVGRPLT
jgi:hypothetical protein